MKPKLVLLTTVLAAAAVWAVAGASASSTNNVYGCIAKSGGDLTIVSVGPNPPTVYKCGGTKVNWKQVAGADGVKGPTGNKGPTGSVGPQGPAGDQGPASSTTGDKGATGNQGSLGDAGLQGPQGDAGTKGATGDKGPTGDTGNTGTTGPSVPAVVTNTDTETALGTGPANKVTHDAACDPGYRLLGGGVWTDDNGTSSIPVLLESHRIPNSDTWRAVFYNAGTTSGDVNYTVYALCSQQPQ